MTTGERKTAETSGRRFYDEQIALLRQDSTDALIDQHYQQNAVLISFAKVVHGHAALKEHFRAYLTSWEQSKSYRSISSSRPQTRSSSKRPSVRRWVKLRSMTLSY